MNTVNFKRQTNFLTINSNKHNIKKNPTQIMKLLRGIIEKLGGLSKELTLDIQVQKLGEKLKRSLSLKRDSYEATSFYAFFF